jgi:SWI/SNF-related matrix-associated actin-dependent regulator of chromatin subfamily A3
MEAELKEEQEDALGLYMNLYARPDSSSFEDWKYSSSQQIRYKTSHVCSFITHIVGLRNHPAIVFSDHELITLVRYQQCPRDKYAIKVFNSTSMEVGYLHDQASAALSPLIDAQMINLEGEVTDSRTGDVKYSVPCLVRVFSKSTDLENVRQSIFGNTLSLTGEPRTNPETNEGKGGKEKGRIEKLGTLEPPKEVIKAKLLDHQKVGLWWLVNKENSDELPPFWEMKDGLYVNVLTRHRTNRKPEPLHGGIFADDYGTGKTLTLLSLIACDKVGNVPEGTGEEDEGVSVCSCKKRGRVSEKGTGEPNTHTLLDSNIKESSGGMADKSSSASVAKQTLIVCPSSVCSTWKNQLLEHTEKGSLKLHKYYGDSKIKDVEELKKYDIVLTTYGAFANESFERWCPLLKIEWWRVILDEADVIKNANAMQSKAVSGLTARRRWAVTGAPIQNGSFDLFALIAFLRLDPLSKKGYWQSLLERPLAKKDGNGFSRLQVISY